MNNALIIFTRVPIAGKTKTRLMPFLSGEECRRLHEAFLEDIAKTVTCVDADCFVFFTPEDGRNLLYPFFGEDGVYYPQKGADIGERMQNAIRDVLQQGYKKAVLIGTDIPQMEPDILEEAFKALDDNEIVIHPTFDGGYYLIGMKKEYDSIWRIKRYGTHTVIDDTLAHMKNANLTVSVGKRYYDIDDKNDLIHLYTDINGGKISNCFAVKEYLHTELKRKLEITND